MLSLSAGGNVFAERRQGDRYAVQLLSSQRLGGEEEQEENLRLCCRPSRRGMMRLSSGLGLHLDLEPEFKIRENFSRKIGHDYAASAWRVFKWSCDGRISGYELLMRQK